MKANKFKARRTVLDGITFDSKAEAARWGRLKLYEAAGLLSNIRRQVPYELAPGVQIHGDDRKRPPIRYVVDFVYRDQQGAEVHEDVKGMDTPISRLKRHLMKTIHGIDVRVIK